MVLAKFPPSPFLESRNNSIRNRANNVGSSKASNNHRNRSRQSHRWTYPLTFIGGQPSPRGDLHRGEKNLELRGEPRRILNIHPGNSPNFLHEFIAQRHTYSRYYVHVCRSLASDRGEEKKRKERKSTRIYVYINVHIKKKHGNACDWFISYNSRSRHRCYNSTR